MALDFLAPSTKPGSLGSLGHYEVLEVVGKGGMGVVFRAFDEKLRRIVAIKALAPALAGNITARMRFVREAQAAAAVTHDNVIAIHAVEDSGPVPYLVMQYIDGCTLQQKLDRGGPLPLMETLRVGLQVAEGLAAAHKHGLTHRDIKPANILLENGVERVKITDFGLARAVDDVNLTGSGYIAGTPAYMSPEQANGERVDHRSDQFSFGSLLYALCAGRPPFQGETSLAVLKRVCDETPPPLRQINPEVPEWLEAVVAKLQAKKPVDRFASATEVARLFGRRLAQFQTEGVFSGVDWGEPTPWRSRKRPANGQRRNRNLAVAAVIVVVGSIASWFAYQAWFAERPAENSAEPTGTPANPAAERPVVLAPSQTLMQHASSVRTLAFSRDGRVMASGGYDRHIYLWDTKTWKPRGPLKGHAGHVTGLAFNPDGTELASVTSSPDECLVRVWDVGSGKQITTLGAGGAGMWDVAYSPDGKTLACGGWDKTLHLFDAPSGSERLTVLEVVDRHLRTLSFSTDGTQIATGGSGPTRVWDAQTGNAIPTDVELRGDLCPTILPGGKGLAGWSYSEGRVTICDLPSGQVRATWKAHQSSIEGLAVSADGRFIATIGNDSIARVWATDDQREVATLIGHKGCVFAVAFSPNGEYMVTGGHDDHSVRVWDLPPECRVAK
jgi:serine/threonine protein kinase